MSYPRLAQRLYNAPLCITRAKLEVIESVFRSYAEGKPEPTIAASTPMRPSAAAYGASTYREPGYWMTKDGIAVLPIVGSLVQRASGMDAMSGITAYESVNAMLDAALADAAVKGMVLDVDSPGGEASGLSDLSTQIRAGTARKPIVAVANEAAFSAAYWLASAAQYLFAPETAMMGSVGVIMFHVDQSKYDEKRGLVYTPIFAGDKKADFSSHAPLSSDARADGQRLVDHLYDQFVNAVARNRGIKASVVRDTEAGVMTIEQATAIGMADGVGGIEQGMNQVRAILRATRKDTK